MTTQNSTPTVRILHPSIDDIGQHTVLRGILDRDSLPQLRCDFYQREKLSTYSRREIIFALENNVQLPDVELGMRGETFQVEEKSGAVILCDPVFIIDGRQRIESLKDFLDTTPDTNAHIGAIVHINTNLDWERSRFYKLNTARAKVSPSLLLKNMKEEINLLASLYGLSTTVPGFCLHNRVCWKQNLGREDLISGMTFVRISLRLHSHLAAVRQASGLEGALTTLKRAEERIGLPLVRKNTETFWTTIDELWGIKEHKLHTNIPYLHQQFLRVFADILSDHVDFWVQPQESRLLIPYDLKQKLKKLPVYDPEIVRLSGASGAAHQTLYFIMIQHLNSGKRTKRLIPRNARAQIFPQGDSIEDEEENVA